MINSTNEKMTISVVSEADFEALKVEEENGEIQQFDSIKHYRLAKE